MEPEGLRRRDKVLEPEELRRRAVECEKKAGTIHDPEMRWELRDIARQCRDLARQVEELDLLAKRTHEPRGDDTGPRRAGDVAS